MSENLVTREQRVRHIAQLMARGEWLNSYSRRCELAASWGVTESAIKHYSAEAHRLLAFDPDERDELRTTLANRMLNIAEDAFARQNEVTGLPDYRSAIQALELFAKFASITPTEAAATLALPPTITVVCKPDDSPEPPAVARVPSDQAE
jgi:hypothetical protein